MRYPRLFEPITIGTMKVRNRISVLPMGMEGPQYQVPDKLTDLYGQMARGGAGLVTLGAVVPSDMFGVHHRYPAGSHSMGCWNDDFIPGLAKFAAAINDAGASACAQLDLHYEWRQDADHPFDAVGASDGPGGPFVGPLRALTRDEVHVIVQQFGDAARRCKQAGFKAIELHAGIGYLLNRFLSSYSNHRTDEYGGSLENRLRIVTETIAACKAQVGDDYPIIVRFNAEDYMPGGNTLADAKQLVPMLEAAGVHALSIQAGFHECDRPLVNQYVPEAVLADVTKQIKAVAHVPVIVGYRITSPETGERLLREGVADIIGMARPFLADPEFANKARTGHPEEIRPCIVCSRCLDGIFVGKELTCSMNAQIASDVLGTPEDHRAARPKKVVVIGAGPGGMEAARVAAIRGHQVTLLEKSGSLGGLWNMASVLNPLLEPALAWYAHQIDKLPIDVRLNTEATTELVRSLHPDEVVVAPGGEVIVPEVRGIDGANVFGSNELKALFAGHAPKRGPIWLAAAVAMRVLGRNKAFLRFGMKLPWPIRKRVVVLGGGFAGWEVAEALMDRRRVTIVEQGAKAGANIGPVNKKTERDMLTEHGVKVLTNRQLVAVEASGVRLRNLETGSDEFLRADTVMPALGVRHNTALYEDLRAAFPSVHIVGDGADDDIQRRTREAVRDGFRVAMQI